MEALYRTLGVMTEQPWLAAVPAVAFLALFALSRTSITLVAAAAWLAYLGYEYAMKLRLLCSGECNIRVDLLLLYPLLVVLSLAALVVWGWGLVRRRS
ncbi:MAG TPA: hypothetical protein VFL90_18860 [Methylomirabilota bacterium]|nr:hypothetical protein [Methylomirabilota bacterium]